MFYNHDFLTSRKAGLRIIWLASTLGSASRKLTKKDYTGVDVVKTCQSVSNPVESLALRTSSHLMYGIARVYTKQAEFWMNDVQTHYEHINKMMAGGGAARKQFGGLVILGKDTTSIDMPERNRPNAITLPARYDFFATHANIDMQWTENDAVGDSDHHLGSLASFRHGSQSSSYAGTGRGLYHSSSLSDLGSGRYTKDPSELRIARATPSNAGDFEVPHLDLDLPHNMNVDEGIDLGLDVDDRSMMPLDDNGFDMQENLQQNEDGLPSAGQENPRIRPRSPSFQAQQRPSRVKKIRFALSDSTTDLAGETIVDWRDNFAAKMSEMQITIMDKNIQRQARQQVDHLVFGTKTTNPLLVQLWDNNVALTRTAIDSHSVDAHVEHPGVGRTGRDGEDLKRPDWQDDTTLQQWDEDPGVGRGAFPSSSPGPASGRARGSQSSDKRNILPWDQPLPRIDMTGDADVTNQTFSRSFSVETPTGLRRQSRRQSSLTLGSVGHPEREDGDQSQELPLQQFYNESQSQGLVPNEDANFMSFINSTRASLPSEQPLFFSDLAPIADSTPHIAARAFHNMLSLATSKLLQVDQQTPYGDIKIAIVAA